jgi:hypothetical protein
MGPGFRKGDPALGVHVPAQDPLSPEACDDSFAQMQDGFSKYYPGEPARIATCTSWLLDDQLADYLSPGSNIIRFQQRFELVPGVREDNESVLRFVFGPDRPAALEALPQRTSLEKAIVNHMKNGGHWRVRTGWVKLD